MITGSYDSDGQLIGVTYTVDGKTNTTGIAGVENGKGILFPETGGIGTIIFTIVGIGIVLGAITVLFVRTKSAQIRKSKTSVK